MISTARMRELEGIAELLGTPKTELMENAGKAVAREIIRKFKLKVVGARKKSAIVFCGQGNNGGDGFVIARELSKIVDVKVVFFGEEAKFTHESKLAFGKLKKSKAKIIYCTENSKFLHKLAKEKFDFWIDTLLGTGFRGKVREPIASAIRAFSRGKGLKIAVDVPSGLNSDTGKGNLYVKADLIYTFHDIKPGLRKFGKKVKVLDIGIPKSVKDFVTIDELSKAFPARKPESRKGQNGKALVVGGSEEFVGAPALAGFAALACLQSGTDIVRVAAPEKVAWAINCMSPDLMTVKMQGKFLSLGNEKGIIDLSRNADAVLIGNGIGLRQGTVELVKNLIKKIRKPIILDADGIKAAKGVKFNGKVLLTPHAKEFEICFGKKLPVDWKKKGKIVKETAKKHGCTILLKGKIDIISDGKKLKFNKTGNPGMTIGGTGDILAGLCLGLVCKKNSLFDAACAAAYLNGLAGDDLYKERNYAYTANDLIGMFPRIIGRIKAEKLA